MSGEPIRASRPPVAERPPFLRMPPFPGQRAFGFSERVAPSPTAGDDALVATLVAELRAARVGGSFWGAQPALPSARDLVLAPSSAAQADAMLARAAAEGLAARAVLLVPASLAIPAGLPRLPAGADPWHIADRAKAIWADADHELALVAALVGTPLATFGEGAFAGLGETNGGASALSDVLASELLGRTAYRDPFSGAAGDARAAIALLADWRRLIDDNRGTAAIFGVARWKRPTVDALLWDGSGRPRHRSARAARTGAVKRGDAALVWKARVPAGLDAALDRQGVTAGEIEDGFIRSTGLGANCVPPLSVVVDRLGAHFDPAQPSALEEILQHAVIPPALAERAAALRQWLVQAGLSKYGVGTGPIGRPGGDRRHVLVTGQVEDDRSMTHGGGGVTNLDLVTRARAMEPDAFITYKPHPDVEAGHRRGHIASRELLQIADRIERSAPISALLDSADAVHVITSLAGFEALMRGRRVITHGVPFFAGWGLTHDLGAVPARRTMRRTLDELVAAVLILYPRYLDPVTRLPCPVETLVDRMVAGQADLITPLVRMRQVQGRLSKLVNRAGGWKR